MEGQLAHIGAGIAGQGVRAVGAVGQQVIAGHAGAGQGRVIARARQAHQAGKRNADEQKKCDSSHDETPRWQMDAAVIAEGPLRRGENPGAGADDFVKIV